MDHFVGRSCREAGKHRVWREAGSREKPLQHGMRSSCVHFVGRFRQAYDRDTKGRGAALGHEQPSAGHQDRWSHAVHMSL